MNSKQTLKAAVQETVVLKNLCGLMSPDFFPEISAGFVHMPLKYASLETLPV